MFERVCLSPPLAVGGEPSLDLGLLAESLLFYGKVHLVVNRTVLQQLLHLLGPDLTLRLAELEYLEVAYCNNFPAVYTEQSGTPSERHLLTVAEMPHTRVGRLAPELLVEALGKSGKGRRLAARLLKHVEHTNLDESIARSAGDDAADEHYVTTLVISILSNLLPGYRLPEDFFFILEFLEDNKIRVNTNLDWAATTKDLQRSFDTNVAITPGLLLSLLVHVHQELAFAARFASEIATSSLGSALLRVKLESLAQQRSRSEEQLLTFQDFVFPEGRTIAEAVRSGQADFAAVLDVVERSRRFHRWLDDKPAEADLVREYFRECTASTWIDRLPAKTTRWLLVTGASTAAGATVAGPVGVGAGLAIGTADFIVDILRSGWSPNHFVEGELRRLIS